MSARRPITPELTETARAGWDRFCTAERISLTALIEALGLELAERHDIIPPAVVERAATIDRNRKSRR